MKATTAIRLFLTLHYFLLIYLKGIRDPLAVSFALTVIAIREAVDLWISDPISASAVYGGPIRTWNTSLVTNMEPINMEYICSRGYE